MGAHAGWVLSMISPLGIRLVQGIRNGKLLGEPGVVANGREVVDVRLGAAKRCLHQEARSILGRNQRRRRGARHLLHHVGGNRGSGIGVENLQIKWTGNGGVDRRSQLGSRVELRRYRRRRSPAPWRH